jgi:hypothetical protein
MRVRKARRFSCGVCGEVVDMWLFMYWCEFNDFWDSITFVARREIKGAEQEEATHDEARLHVCLFCKANFASAPCALTSILQ